MFTGMGVPTVTAARILKGQRNGQSGEETQLEMEKFPFVSLAKVRFIDVVVYHTVQHSTEQYLCVLYYTYAYTVLTVTIKMPKHYKTSRSRQEVPQTSSKSQLLVLGIRFWFGLKPVIWGTSFLDVADITLRVDASLKKKKKSNVRMWQKTMYKCSTILHKAWLQEKTYTICIIWTITPSDSFMVRWSLS